MMLIYTMALAYGVASPIILPLALIYFIVQLCAPHGMGHPLQGTCARHCCCLLHRRFKFPAVCTPLACPGKVCQLFDSASSAVIKNLRELAGLLVAV